MNDDQEYEIEKEPIGNMYDSVTQAVVEKHGTVWTIIEKPDLVKISKGPSAGTQKLVLTVTPNTESKEVFALWCNKTSRNYFVDKFGPKRGSWVGQIIELETINQLVNGELRHVIYAKGSIKEAKPKLPPH